MHYLAPRCTKIYDRQYIISESAEYDLTIIGATREGLLQQFVFGGIPEEVGRRAENTVIMAKRNLGISSSLSRLLGRSNR